MIPIERHYRYMMIAERLNQVQGEMASTAASLYRVDEDLELEQLSRAERFLQLAVRAMDEAKAEAQRRCQPELLAAQLSASVELIHQSPERLRARQNGESA